MLEAPTLPNDKKRVASLHKLHLLDTPIEERFERITRMACRMLDVPVVAFTLVDELRQTFKSAQGICATDVPRGVSLCGHVIASDMPLIVPDTFQDARFQDNPLINGAPPIRFYAGCPVHAPDGEKIGTFCAIDNQPRDFTPEQVVELQDMARMVETELRVVMLSKAQAELLTQLDTAQRSALIDPLTRLWNRGGISELLKREWEHAIELKTPLSVVIADIDHFKNINDTYGHLIGDEVLKYTGQTLLSKLRAADGIGRLGGEEFLIVLPSCAANALIPVVERIRQSFAATPVATSAGDIPMTLSFGAVAVVPEELKSLIKTVACADEALYAAKRAGRNRVEIGTMNC